MMSLMYLPWTYLSRTSSDIATEQEAREGSDSHSWCLCRKADVDKAKKAFEAAAKEAKVWMPYRGPLA
jgi:hypothetical protein